MGTDLFGFKIIYNEGVNPLYNGNIALTQWKTANTDSSLKTYDYTYDALNRITSATDNISRYNLSGMEYGKNGNITNLTRKGHIVDNPVSTNSSDFGTMDVLSYNYETDSNKLIKVTDAILAIPGDGGFKDGTNTGNDYTYDANGNMKTDANKGITAITYNHLNLPTSVTLPGGTISYIYDATGVKQRKVAAGTTTDYVGNYIYENNVLRQFSNSEGYVEPDGSGGFDYVYSYLDHLGNTRLNYSDFNGNGTIEASSEILDERNYYPFGLEHQGYNTTIVSENNYQTYQGQELEEELGKNTLAFQWRDYDPAIARFNKIDRFAEKYQSINPYHFSANNPVFFREIKGDSINVTDLYRTNKDGSYANPNQVKAFEAFAGTKGGKKYLSKFASKGQNIAGIEFNSDGEYHSGGIDLNFDTDLSRNDGRDGETGVGENNNGESDGNGRFQINLSLGAGSGKYDVLESLTHEFFIHAINDAKDISDNRKVDYSNIDKDIRENNKPSSRHHLQENRNAQNGRSLFGTQGYQILRQGNGKFKANKTDTQIWNTMWGFLY